MPGKSDPHRARDLAMHRRDRIGAVRALAARAPSCRTLRRSRTGSTRPSPSEVPRGDIPSLAQRAEVLFDERPAEAIVAGRDRRVRREHDLADDAARSLRRSDAFRRLHAGSDQLEAANALCPSLRCTTPGEIPSAASARIPPTPSSSSCLDADALSPPYSRAVSCAIFRAVALDVRVEQQQRAAADSESATRARPGDPVRVSISTVTGTPSRIAGSMGAGG